MKHKIILVVATVGLVLLLSACFTPLKPGCHRERVYEAGMGWHVGVICDDKKE